MKAIELYKFVSENTLEYHDCEDDVILFVPLYHLEDFSKILGDSTFDDEGIKCTMNYNYICFMMKDICKYHGLELYDIFEKGK